MKVHELKIKGEYAPEILAGKKKFELRKNDRDYQVGDLIKFKVVDAESFLFSLLVQGIEDEIYKITYVLKDVPEYGLDKDYCILGIVRLKED